MLTLTCLIRLRLNSLLGKIHIPSSNCLEHEMVTGFSCPIMLRAMTTKTAHAQAMTDKLTASKYLLETIICGKIHPISREVSIRETRILGTWHILWKKPSFERRSPSPPICAFQYRKHTIKLEPSSFLNCVTPLINKRLKMLSSGL